jgi:putative membrane protein
MAVEDFFSAEGKASVTHAVRDAEARTSAEVVVAMRRRSATYREAEAIAAILAGLAVLVYLLVTPHPISTLTIPVRVVVGGALGALLVAWLSPLKRVLVPATRRRGAVRLVARAAFVDLGVSRTTGRTGILVFVSAFERDVEIVADVAVDAGLLEPSRAALAAAVSRWDLAAFTDALRAIGPALATALPHAADDVNELPDEPVAS